MDQATLKAELKAWEAQFRAANGGTDPTKADIKANAEIANKYKVYNKAKSARLSVPPSQRSLPASTSASGGGRPAPPDVFKTPTKPRPRSSLPAFSPSKRSAERNAASGPDSAGLNGSGGRVVVSNSPAKLRALAAAHSHSPNSRPTNGTSNGFTPSEGVVTGSPKKANPFAASSSSAAPTLTRGDSPARKNGARNLFGEMFATGSSTIRRTGSRSSTATASAGPSSSQGLHQVANRSSANGNALSGPATKVEEKGKSWESIFNGSRADQMEVDEDVLGPSPVKPRARGTFKPLLEDEAQSDPESDSTYSISSTSRAPPPRSALSQSLPPSTAAARERGPQGGVHPLFAQLPRGVKRSANAAASAAGAEKNAFSSLPASKAKGKGKAPAKMGKPGESEGEEYPSEESEVDQAGAVRPDKKKVKPGAKARTKAQPKEKWTKKMVDDDEEMDIGQARRATAPAPPLVVSLEEDAPGDQPNMGKGTLRIQRWGRSRSRQTYGQDDEDDSFLPSSQPSLLYRETNDLLSQSSQLPREPAELVPDSPTAQVPSELVQLLSIRSPPKSIQLRARQQAQQFSDLLRDPRTAKPKRGLEDLSDEDSPSEGDAREEEGEDDWESEAEGWKEEDAGWMDDYDKPLEL